MKRLLTVVLFFTCLQASAMGQEYDSSGCTSWFMTCLSTISGAGAASYICEMNDHNTQPYFNNQMRDDET